MQVANVKEVFDALAARRRVPRLGKDVGTWQFEIDDAGSWAVKVDHGNVTVQEGKDPAATALFNMSEAEFLRIARGENHENLLTAGLRGGLRFKGDLPFAQRLQALLPLADEDERSRS